MNEPNDKDIPQIAPMIIHLTQERYEKLKYALAHAMWSVDSDGDIMIGGLTGVLFRKPGIYPAVKETK